MNSAVRLVCWLRIDISTSVLAESRQTGARLALPDMCHMFDMVTPCDIAAYSSLTKHPYLCLSHHFLYILYIV